MHSCIISGYVYYVRTLFLQFDSILTNYGNGYVTSGGDQGKFNVPYNGTYTFTVTVRNQFFSVANPVHATVRKITGTSSSEDLCKAIGDNRELETGMCTVVVKLSAGDVVAVVNTGSETGKYGSEYTTFSGHLVKRDK